MVATRKIRQTNRRFFGQLDNFDEDIVFGNTESDRQKNATVTEGSGDQELIILAVI